MKRRITSLLLAVALVLALLPGTVMAEEETREVIYGSLKFDLETGTITGVTNKTNVTRIIIPREIEGRRVEKIGDGAFDGCTRLSTITIPDSVTEIGAYAFRECAALSSVKIPLLVTAIGNSAFYNCTKLTEAELSPLMKEIGTSAFANTGLTAITIPGTVTEIGEKAFMNCNSLTSVIIQEHVNEAGEVTPSSTTIGNSAFAGTGNSLKSVTIPGSVGTIGNSAFSGRTSLNCVIISEGVKEIGENAFFGCTALNRLFLPSTLSKIGQSAFTQTTNLSIIHYNGSEGHLRDDIDTLDAIKDCVVHSASVDIRDDVENLTCTSGGSITVTIGCDVSGCPAIPPAETHVIPPLPHALEDDAGTPATCDKDGKTYGLHCSRCGAVLIAQETIPATGHTWVRLDNTFQVTKAPTCKDPGVGTVQEKCSVCNVTQTVTDVEIPPTGLHTYEKGKYDLVELEPATCTKAGRNFKVRFCDICDEPDVDVTNDDDLQYYYKNEPTRFGTIDMLPHTRGDDVEVTETPEGFDCTKEGFKVTLRSACKVCGNLFTEEEVDWEPSEHVAAEITDENIETTKEPTCTEKGEQVITPVCAVCGHEMEPETKEIDALGHDFGEWVVIEEAACEEEGLRRATCTRCGEVKEETIPATGHDYEGAERTIIKEPACTEAGIASAPCNICGKEGTFEIPALGHLPAAPDLEKAETIKEPTCTEDGVRMVTTVCQREGCGEVLQDTPFPIPALGHDFGEWTTGAGGVRTRTCTRCGEVQKDGGSNSGDDDSNNPGSPSDPDDPGTTTPSDYSIRVIRPSNGESKASASSAVSGTIITLTFTPNDGYELDSVRVTRTSSGRAVTVSKTGTNRYTFTMPAANVEVRADFTAIPNYAGGSSSGTSTPVSQRNQPTSVIQASPQISASSQLYADVSTGHWAAGEIAWVSQRGYMSGSGNSFRPDSGITQQQMWMVLARAMGQNPSSMAAANQWAVINGFAEGGNPTAAVTRQQLVKALYGTARLMGSTNRNVANLGSYADYRTISSGYRDAMGWAVANGIISGNAEGRLNPTGSVTRAQFAVILYRFYQRAF